MARSTALTTPAGVSAQMIGQYLMGEWEDAFRVQVVLAVALGSVGLREPIVDLIAATSAGMAQYSIKDAPTFFVLVEAQILQVIQGA